MKKEIYHIPHLINTSLPLKQRLICQRGYLLKPALTILPLSKAVRLMTIMPISLRVHLTLGTTGIWKRKRSRNLKITGYPEQGSFLHGIMEIRLLITRVTQLVFIQEITGITPMPILRLLG